MVSYLYKFLIFLSILFLLSCSSKEEKNAAGAQKNTTGNMVFDAIVVRSIPINRSIEAPGTILPNEIADLHPEISGRVTGIFFNEGGFVRKGTLLVKLFDADLQAQLKKLIVQLQIAQAVERRQKELLAVNGTSQQDYENSILQVNNINADLHIIKANISKTEIRAPFDGRVGLRQISPGAYVTPAVTITNIASVSQKKIEFSIPEQYIKNLMNGSSVVFSTAGSDKKYFATVMATENKIAEDTRNLMVRAIVKNSDDMVKSGAFASVFISIGTNTPTMMIPTQSVIPQTRGKKVIVVRHGMAVFQNVGTGYRDSSSVEILSGLMNGDTVLVSGLLIVKQQQPINKLNVKKE